ncbi:zinc finger protein 595 [Halyomorpha halys]|uniref:zinc finger protein 595 n=1 Tax=Halyomorpha halys TaxID=286706 RepID=UPI0006D4D349|nr:zinc finger protein 595 [Halyomorpha halys]XP_014270416.1 zinc finger protein 595 [Halyomorpha halys]XP_014270417.1 zinc finger protein 595 [Halyomorpha halys]
MKLIVKNNAGETVSIQIKSNETFLDLKERVEEEAGISLDLKDIALKGKKITESQRVMEYFLSYGESEDEPPTNVYCAVPGCKNTKATNPDKVFFEFPSEEIRCHQWVLYCQRLNIGPGKKRLSLTSESTICSDHFRPDQFVKNTNTLLKRTAVPCVKVGSGDQLSKLDIQFKEFEGHESPQSFDNEDNKQFFYEDTEDTKKGINLRLCRLCATSSDEFFFIFDEIGRELKIAEKINLCLPIEVQMTDAFPKQICKPCFNQLNDIFEMADMCSISQQKMIALTDNEIFNDEELMTVVDENGEEVVLGSSAKNILKGCCPLCNEGNLKSGEHIAEDRDLLPMQGIDSIILDGQINRNNSIDKVSDVFSESEFTSENDTVKRMIGIRNDKKMSDIAFPKVNCDTSDLDSLAESSPSQVFNKEVDPLKIDDNSSKSESDQIIECYSSLSSPLNILSTDDSNSKNINEDPLSVCNEELQIEPDLYYMDTESESANITNQESSEKINCSSKHSFVCRLCASEFEENIDLLRHAFVHSCHGFYQCSSCVTFFTTKDELENHFKYHESKDNTIYCDVCNLGFKSALDLGTHTCKQDSFPPNKCPVCYKYFRSVLKLKQHMKFHEAARPSYCNICDKFFSDDIKLQKHSLYVHSSRKAHCCEECGKVFKSEASMKYHQRAHQTEERIKPYTCERCGKSFMRKSMLINHMTSSHNHTNFETPCFTCKLCNEAFPSTVAAVAHMDNHHKLECMDEATYSFEMHTINRLFVCEFCERCYAEGSVLNSHREMHPSDSPYECKLCDAVFPSIEEVKIHRKNYANEKIPAEYIADFTIPKTYLCEFCERYFLNYVKYTEHLTVHYGPEPYQCRSCPLKFSTLVDAMEHRSIHGESQLQVDEYNFYRPYECHYCSKTFAIEDALIKHIRMHTGEKPFICDQCGKGFSQSSGLYTHQKVHSSERPYSCTVCPRKFKIKGDRDVHVRKHSGDRPYKCEFCGKAFMTQHVYSQHRKIHTGERPYKCDVCGIAFRRSHVLTVHKRIHTGEKPNICDICGKRYRQKGDMLKHRRVQHGILSTKQNINSIVDS